jgi:AraC-like DNA-binding protein
MAAGGAQVHRVIEALRALHLDTERLCRSVRLDPATLLTPGARVPWRVFIGLFASAEALSGDPLVGLHAAAASATSGILSDLARAQATVEQALRQLARFAHIAVEEFEVEFSRRRGHSVVRIALGSGELAAERHAREFLAGLLVIELRESSRRRFRPSEVRFPHAPAGPVEEYERILECPVRFRRADLELLVAEDMLEVRLVTRSPQVADVLEEAALRELALAQSPSFRARLELALLSALARSEDPVPERIAGRLGLSLRTLQRRLAEERTSFREVREGACRARAIERMLDPATTVSQVAAELGFADVSAFSKAFKRWTGENPTAWRRREGGAASGGAS